MTMIYQAHDCGIETYDEILGFSDASSNDLDGSTPTAGGSDISPSPSRVPLATGGDENNFGSQRHLTPDIHVSKPSGDNQGTTGDDESCSNVGCGNGRSSHACRNADQTECSPYNSDSSCCSLRVPDAIKRGRRRVKQPGRYHTGEASGVCSNSNGACGFAENKGRTKEQNGSNDPVDDDWLASDSEDETSSDSHSSKMRLWKQKAQGSFENMLLDCIVNTDDIAPNYGDIFTSGEVIERLERTTKLSLDRTKAFSFGVLKKNKITGAILYGPPGTGKSLLVKALAKASGYNMICVTTSEVWQKCHGDDQRMVQAIFRLARKIHPCIVFVDEADAMLGQRKQGERRHMKAVINQFLIEWDGLGADKETAFVLLATNRPTDLDPAVIRRAPEQIFMGKPKLEERVGIINLLLQGEKLGKGLGANWLARMTDGYTGSDLKSVCVTAATICVGQQSEDTEDRVLERHHFIRAINTIGASRVKQRDGEEYNSFGGKVEKNNFGTARNHGQDDEEDD